MKTKLFTKNLSLGLLLGFVLMLGVQGTADATSTTISEQSSSDKTRARSIRETFTISGSVSLNDTTATESVTITISDGTTLTQPIAITSTTTLTEADHDGDGAGTADNGRFFTAENDGRSPSTSFSGVSGYFTTPGAKTITIEDTTAGWSRTYTYYVWRRTSESRTLAISSLSNNVVETREDKTLSVTLTGANSEFARVEFEVFKGPGTLYEDKDSNNQPDKTPAKKLTAFTNNHGTASIASVYLRPNNGTSHVRAWVSGNSPGTTGRSTEAIYIYKWSVLKKVSGDSPEQTAPAASRLENPFVVQLFDSTERTKIPGATITFAALDGGSLAKDPNFPSDLYNSDFNTSGNVKTDSEGKANVFLVLPTTPTDGTDQGVTVTFTTADTVTFNASVSSGDRTPQTIEIMSGTDGQKANQYGVLEKALTVIVRDQYGDRLPNAVVEFEARDGGTINNPMSGDSGITPTDITTPTLADSDSTSRRKDIITDSSGEASVRYLAADGSGAQKVTATLEDGSRRFKTFTINGKPSTTPSATTPTTSPRTVTPSLTITTTGEGTTRSVTVTARNAQNAVVPGIGATLSGTALTTSQIVITGTPVSITLPTPPGTYTLQAVAGGYTTANINVTVVAPPEPGRLSIGLVGTQVNGQQTIEVTARDSDGTAPSGALTVSLSGAGISRTVTITNGSGRAIIALPATPATLTASATGYTSGTLTLPARTTTTTTTTTPTTPTGGTAESIEIDGNRQISGTLAVATPLRVRVLDANDAGVSKVGVVFRVLTPGAGTFAGARGAGRAIRLETDRSGTARANFTPTTEGDIIVEAKAAGVTAPVTFIIDVGETSTPTTPATSPNTGETPEPSRTIDPEVLMDANQRPPMVWVDGGTIYALVGADVQEFATGVENVQNLAVSGNKVYYTEKTGENAGTINAMNLDGTGAKQLVSIKAVPQGIAVDSVGKRLYWTNSHGWIQSSNLQGTARRNVAKGLSNPMGIAVAAGKTVYWTEDGPSSPELLNGHTGQSVPGVSVAISGNTLYWTAKTGENAGTIHSVNLNGTGAKHLVSIKAVPMGITVDSVGKRLYWTNSHGWIQSSNLQGTARRNVAKGLGSPGGIALSANIKAPATTPTTTSTPVSGGGSKYDVNGDGTVDSKDVDAVLLAVSAGLTLAKYDVNGDKNVDIKDIMAVNANLTAGAAGAPTLLGTKFTAIEIDRLQAQIDLLIATGDRSPAAMKTLIYLQQLIAMARPEKTQLLANYPNPFNPETWIPYELATDTDVRITIYNAQGVVIRTLQLGQQSAGYYTDRERAAYWDGRNALGEQVASGIYFYQLETDAMSSLRKMVILK